MSKAIYLIGGVDSFGVPYTKDNKDNENHLRVVYNFLRDCGIEPILIDMYSMHKYNDTDYVNGLLNENIDLYKIKENQIESIDLCRKSGIFQFIQLPAKTKRIYQLNEEDKNQILSNIIRDNRVLFIYSCGVNDFLKEMNTNLAKMLNPKNMEMAFNNLTETIALIIKKIDKNIRTLIELNHDIEIYVMGIYIPTRVRYIRNSVTKPIEIYNIALKELCEKYDNVHFIDNSNLGRVHMAHVDWHPNYRGQRLMGKNIQFVIEQESKIIKSKKIFK